MLLSLARLSKYGFNQRSLDMADFFRICDEERIIIIESNSLDNSFYMAANGSKFIVIGKTKSELERLYIALHELAHYFLSGHKPVDAAFYGHCDTRAEREADAFASIAIIPRSKVGNPDIYVDCCCGVGLEIYNKRIDIFNTYGI